MSKIFTWPLRPFMIQVLLASLPHSTLPFMSGSSLFPDLCFLISELLPMPDASRFSAHLPHVLHRVSMPPRCFLMTSFRAVIGLLLIRLGQIPPQPRPLCREGHEEDSGGCPSPPLEQKGRSLHSGWPWARGWGQGVHL